MATLTITVPDELSTQLSHMQDRLPELLALSLQQPAIPASIYRAVISFLASRPSAEQIIAYQPTPEMQNRLSTLMARNHAGTLTSAEQAELDEFEQIEHMIIMLKAGCMPHLMSTT